MILHDPHAPKLGIRPMAAFKGLFVTREPVGGRTDFLPEDIVEWRDVEPPIENERPISFLLFTQAGRFRAILANVRPQGHREWTTWPADEKQWLLDALGELMLLFQYGHLPEVVAKLNEHGIAFSVGVKPAPMARIIEAVHAGKNVDAEIEAAFEGFSWTEPADEWRMNAAWRRRDHLMQDAIRCLETGAPGGAITEILSQIEGVLMDYLLRFGDGVNEKGQALPWTKRLEQLAIRLRNEQLGPVRRLVAETTLSYLREGGLYENFSWRDAPPKFSRHPTLHGRSVDFATKSNAIRALLALDALYWVTGFQHRDQQVRQ